MGLPALVTWTDPSGVPSDTTSPPGTSGPASRTPVLSPVTTVKEALVNAARAGSDA